MSTDEDEEISNMIQYVPQVGEIFDVKGKIGRGTFSNVYKAVIKKQGYTDKEFALKYIIPIVMPSRIANELSCLKEVGGSNNIVGLEFCMMNKGHVIIVMPYYPHENFSEFIALLSLEDMREYMKNLLIALSEIHGHGIIHRDVKPSNFLHNRATKNYTLVDFGLAQRSIDIFSSASHDERQTMTNSHGRWNQTEHISKKQKLSSAANEPTPSTSSLITSVPSSSSQLPFQLPYMSRRADCGCFGQPYVCEICLGKKSERAPRAGTPGYRAPEVLLKYKYQTSAIDIWSAGVIFLSLLSKKYPFFRAEDDMSTLAEIIFVVGSDEMNWAASAIGKKLTMKLPETTEAVSGVRRQLTPARFLQALCLIAQQEQPCFIHPSTVKNEQNEACMICHNMCCDIPELSYDLLNKMLDPNPLTRICASQALWHPFITGVDL